MTSVPVFGVGLFGQLYHTQLVPALAWEATRFHEAVRLFGPDKPGGCFFSRNDAMRRSRFLSPTTWFTAVVLFFLPWFDFTCQSKDGAGYRLTMSGAQLAWGGGTCTGAAERRSALIDLHELTGRSGWQTVGGLLLTAYLFGLGFAVIFAFRRPARISTAWIGCGVSAGLIVLLFAGSWLALGGNPFTMGRETSAGAQDPSPSPLTAWYLGSYCANLLAMAFCLAEDWYARRLSRQQRLAPFGQTRACIPARIRIVQSTGTIISGLVTAVTAWMARPGVLPRA